MYEIHSRKSSPCFITSLLLSLMAASACKEEKLTALDKKCQELGICTKDESTRPVVLDILDDNSIGSTGTAEHLRQTLRPTLRFVAARSGRVRLWMLGGSGATLTPVGEQATPNLSGRRGKGKAREIESWIESAENYFAVAAAPTFAASPIRKSPLGEALSVIGLRDAGNADRVIIVLSDARETATANFECGELPLAAKWIKSLDKKGALLPDSLAGVEVKFAFFGMAPLPGCPADLIRQRDVKALWETALRRTGATVVFESGLPAFTTAPKVGTAVAEVQP